MVQTKTQIVVVINRGKVNRVYKRRLGKVGSQTIEPQLDCIT